MAFYVFCTWTSQKSKLLEKIERSNGLKGSRIGHGAMATTWTIICILFFVSACSMFGASRPSSSYTSSDTELPDDEIISYEDTSYGNVIRKGVRINYKANGVARDSFDNIAKAEVKKITNKQPVNAIMIFFFMMGQQ